MTSNSQKPALPPYPYPEKVILKKEGYPDITLRRKHDGNGWQCLFTPDSKTWVNTQLSEAQILDEIALYGPKKE